MKPEAIFKKYEEILSVLDQLANYQGKKLLFGNKLPAEQRDFDAIAPDGIGIIEDPKHLYILKTKYFDIN